MKKTLIFALITIVLPLYAARQHPESFYQERFCKSIPGAQMEVVAPDGTRCDILTDEYAIEVDFANKWAEAIGQALNYAIQFNKRPGIVLISESPNDYKYIVRLNTIIAHFKLPIRLWRVEPSGNFDFKKQ